jgi:hypothetical protein
LDRRGKVCAGSDVIVDACHPLSRWVHQHQDDERYDDCRDGCDRQCTRKPHSPSVDAMYDFAAPKLVRVARRQPEDAAEPPRPGTVRVAGEIACTDDGSGMLRTHPTSLYPRPRSVVR